MIFGDNVNGVWVEEFNTDTSMYTRRDPGGDVLEQRPMSDVELAQAAQLQNEATLRNRLQDSQAWDNLRAVAGGSGAFDTAAQRDAAIRLCAKAIVALVRLYLRKLDSAD